MKIHVILLAAGSGLRFGSGRKKQFVELAGKPVVAHALDFFVADARVRQVVLVLPADDLAAFQSLPQKVTTTIGGTTRADSVKNGFLALQNAGPQDVVMVHDAARPLVSQTLCDRILAKLTPAAAVIPALPVAETLKKIAGDKVLQTLDRDALALAQTPQAATYDLFAQAFARCAVPLAALTDEAMLFENCGFPVFLVSGDRRNLKITTPDDLALAEFYLRQKF